MASPASATTNFGDYASDTGCSAATGAQLFVTSDGERLGPFALPRTKGSGDCP